MSNDLVSLTYREIAAHFGISIDGARMKAHRAAKAGRWQIRPGNHPQDPSIVTLPSADLAKPNRRERYAPEQNAVATADNGNTEQLLTALQSSVALVERLLADNRDAQAEIRRLNQAVLEAKMAHQLDAVDLAATSAREMGTKAELDRALAIVDELQWRLARARRPLWRKALRID